MGLASFYFLRSIGNIDHVEKMFLSSRRMRIYISGENYVETALNIRQKSIISKTFEVNTSFDTANSVMQLDYMARVHNGFISKF